MKTESYGNVSANNQSTWLFYNLYNQPIPDHVAVSGAIVGVVIMVIGSFGNILVILAIFLSKPLTKVSNTFVVSLAICDLFRTLCVMPLNIYTYLVRSWRLGENVCIYILFANNLTILEGILHVCAIAFYRYVIILHPRVARCLRSVKAVSVMIILLYTVPLIITIVPAMDRLKDREGPVVEFNTKIMFCSLLRPGGALKLVRVLRKSLFLAFSAVFLFYCYIRIYIAVHRSRKQLHVRGQFSPQRVEHEMTLLKTFLIVFLCFVLSYMPLAILTGVDKRKTISHSAYLPAVIMLWVSASTNWMIYGLFNRQYLQAYKFILCFIRPRRFSRETTGQTANGTIRLRTTRSMEMINRDECYNGSSLCYSERQSALP